VAISLGPVNICLLVTRELRPHCSLSLFLPYKNQVKTNTVSGQHLFEVELCEVFIILMA